MTAAKKYKIKVHKLVTVEDSKKFDVHTKEKIKKKCKEMLSVDPENVGLPLRFELKDYRKLVIFNAYRIVYKVIKDEVLVFVLAVGIRRNSEVYADAIKRLKWGEVKYERGKRKKENIDCRR